jgi:hypothetical protein
VFSLPSGPAQDPRSTELLPVYKHDELEKNNLWATICDQVCDCSKDMAARVLKFVETVVLLYHCKIKFTSINLARFHWEERGEDSICKTVCSRTTIWVGVLPNSTNGDAASVSACDISNLHSKHGIDNLDVAYCESEVRFLNGPVLYAPVEHFHPLANVIDSVTTSLSLSILAMNNLNIEGHFGLLFQSRW